MRAPSSWYSSSGQASIALPDYADEILAHWQAAVQADPDDPLPHLELAQIYQTRAAAQPASQLNYMLLAGQHLEEELAPAQALVGQDSGELGGEAGTGIARHRRLEAGHQQPVVVVGLERRDGLGLRGHRTECRRRVVAGADEGRELPALPRAQGRRGRVPHLGQPAGGRDEAPEHPGRVLAPMGGVGGHRRRHVQRRRREEPGVVHQAGHEVVEGAAHVRPPSSQEVP